MHRYNSLPTSTRAGSNEENACQRSTHEHHRITCESEVALPSHAPRLFGVCGEMLLRKEVIQPHLPVRLPCYDLVLIASPTFDGSLHKGWATGFGCYRLS